MCTRLMVIREVASPLAAGQGFGEGQAATLGRGCT
jgi:hypothetical protein